MSIDINDFCTNINGLIPTLPVDRKKSDIIVFLTHCVLIKKGFRCLIPNQQPQSGAYLLPLGWHENQGYNVQYTLESDQNGPKFDLWGFVTGNCEEMTLKFECSEKRSQGEVTDSRYTVLPIGLSTVSTEGNNISNMVPELGNLVSLLELKLIEPHIPPTSLVQACGRAMNWIGRRRSFYLGSFFFGVCVLSYFRLKE